ncbi:YkvA family protein [Streptomyces zaomyceticus]|uniref:YkvA family protein n=1 Tax=Streptomyces zaomyceticus TaxID=68286 RepID=A0ABZ1L1J1_9ACTN|nr:YkvA family protein [Streptomyces zaomyceticus]
MDSTVWLVVALVLVLVVAGYAAVLLVRVFRARRLLMDAGVPLQSKALFWAAVVYTVSPVDLVPDPVYLDDIGVLLIALKALHAAAAKGEGLRRLPADSGGPGSGAGRSPLDGTSGPRDRRGPK